MDGFARAVAAAAIVLGGFASNVRAQTVNVVTFTAVDAVEVSASRLTVTGVRKGQANASTVEFVFYSNSTDVYHLRPSCERLAMVAMSKPGQYELEITDTYNGFPKCKLVRETP